MQSLRPGSCQLPGVSLTQGWGTTGCCHGEAVTSEELQGEVREVQTDRARLPGCTGYSKVTVRQQVRSGERVCKKKDLKIGPFQEMSWGSTWMCRHCRNNGAELTVEGFVSHSTAEWPPSRAGNNHSRHFRALLRTGPCTLVPCNPHGNPKKPTLHSIL